MELTGWHWTRPSAVESIERHGWQPGRGGCWGAGAYFATDQETANLYARSWGTTCVEAELAPRKVLGLAAHGYSGSVDRALREQAPEVHRTGIKIARARRSTYGVADEDLWLLAPEVSLAATWHGFDAINVREYPYPTMGPGGNQIVVLKPEVIRDWRVVEKPVLDEWQCCPRWEGTTWDFAVWLLQRQADVPARTVAF